MTNIPYIFLSCSLYISRKSTVTTYVLTPWLTLQPTQRCIGMKYPVAAILVSKEYVILVQIQYLYQLAFIKCLSAEVRFSKHSAIRETTLHLSLYLVFDIIQQLFSAQESNVMQIILIFPYLYNFLLIPAGSSQDTLVDLDFTGSEDDAVLNAIGIMIESKDEVCSIYVLIHV